ncbi:MAG TPA: hypothetical protein VFJ58_20425, partial [Armatimonadota bacterium]|nr:hypothetical protein [Armatimonadota bacterium]
MGHKRLHQFQGTVRGPVCQYREHSIGDPDQPKVRVSGTSGPQDQQVCREFRVAPRQPLPVLGGRALEGFHRVPGRQV